MPETNYLIKGGDVKISFGAPYDDTAAKKRFRNLSSGIAGLVLIKFVGKEEVKLAPTVNSKKRQLIRMN